MGIITMALVAGGFQAPEIGGKFHVQTWVQVACAAAIGIGTAVGGWKVIKTLGHHLTKLGPAEGFAAETSAAIVLTIAAALGVPTSTTHTITGSILGLGATRGMSSVRWGLGEKIILAWVFTLPSTIMMGGGLYWLLAKALRV
jgi:PiT family inorganic phosphate transporter